MTVSETGRSSGGAPETAPAPSSLAQRLGEIVDAVREAAPLTQCVTNSVVTGFTANVLLAAGASPAMVDSIEEGPDFARIADGTLINIGTLNASTAEAMRAIAEARQAAGRPWVLDPVAVGPMPFRTDLARDLLAFRPSVVRGNASEILGLAGGRGSGKGVDAGDEVESAVDEAHEIAQATGGAVAVSGAIDAILTAEGPGIRLANGNPIMTKVTGVGCALGALVAAYLPVAGDAQLAAAAATAMMTVAADDAAIWASGPGSFAVELLDALGRIDGATLAAAVDLR